MKGLKEFVKGYEWQCVAFVVGCVCVAWFGYALESKWCAAGFGCSL